MIARFALFGVLVVSGLAACLSGCNAEGRQPDTKAMAPPPVQVEKEADGSQLQVDHPDQFPLVTAAGRSESPELTVNGAVSADVSRNVPVVSLASGRVVEVHARLGDEVTKGQLLVRVQSADITAAFSDFRKAWADESLTRSQLDRARLLFEKGAIAQKDLEVAQSAVQKASVDLQAAAERLRVLGADPSYPANTIDVNAPSSGVIIEQNVTNAAGVKSLDNSPNLFTIADLSNVWIICDVYENNLAEVHVGDTAEVRLNAYPNRVLTARITNISPILDPTIRTAKVRLEVPNPGYLRLGMFVTATFHGRTRETCAVVPASAVLHLHDRDWVYMRAGEKNFLRIEVTAGKMLPPDRQEIIAGVKPGDQVVANALVLQNTGAQ